jgi:uncharacterized protein
VLKSLPLRLDATIDAVISKHNIVVPVKDSDSFLVVNPLYEAADLITAEEKDLLLSEDDRTGDFADRGYLTEDSREKSAFKLAYLDFVDRRDNDEIQLFFVPNYSCNFACSYCYQEGYHASSKETERPVMDAFFDYIESAFAHRRKYVTVFGGEPLMPGERQRELMRYFLDKAREAHLEIAFVTNGYTLSSYVSLLRDYAIREIQVTLDGTESVHNQRRYLKGKKPTFQKIVEGVDACLNAGIPINLRMVADRDNLENLPDLAQFAIDKGWTASELFKTQIGRNYELHHCNSSPGRLFDRVSLYAALYELLKEHPHIVEFYKPAFSIMRHLAENGELPMPLFDSCPACKTEWAFDFTGTIYSCTATVGKRGEELGSFYPHVTLNQEAIEVFQERDVTTIEACRSCSLALACGGGCASVAKNKNGAVLTPDCRPVKELLSLGTAFYFNH